MKNMKFSGHTMGVPNKNIYEAMKFLKELGYEGIEVRIALNGQIDSEKISDSQVRDIYQKSQEIGINFSCLTSYYKDFVNLNVREKTISCLKRVIEIADMLKCSLIRVYGGLEPCPEGLMFVDNWDRTVTGIREVAKYAGKFGVKVCVETHIGSLTMSVRDTIRMIEDINMNNVGMLFDYAWVEVAGVEKGKQAVQKAARHIFHCHVKDWKLISKYPLKKNPCLMGNGTVEWVEVLNELKNIGYIGYISDEYEKFWYPDILPEPEKGMSHNLKWLKNILS